MLLTAMLFMNKCKRNVIKRKYFVLYKLYEESIIEPVSLRVIFRIR